MSKCLSSSTRHEAFNSLASLQLGVGVKGGCEAVIHATSQLMSSIPPHQGWTLLLDFSNAFNCIDRGSMFAEIRRRIPSLSAWMESCYSSQPLLYLGSNTIHSCSGVQQGDPLGPLGFALTLHPLVERIKAEVPNLVLNAWYLDDGTLMGCPDDLATALRIIEEDGPLLGLHLNRAKSLLFIPEDVDVSVSPLPSDIPITRQGFTLLGCPIGPPSYCEEVFGDRIAKMKHSLEALRDIGDSQMETALLRSCLSFPKISFILRTCPISHIHHAAREFDGAIRISLESIMGGPISEWSWLKASLPSSLGGLNLRSAVFHASAAFLASSQQSSQLVERILGQPSSVSPHANSILASLADAAARPEWTDLEHVDIPFNQRSLSRTIDEATHHRLLSSAPDTRSQALALSTGLPHVGDWLNVIPSAQLGLHLHDRDFRCCLRYWLGVPIYSGAYTCPACHHLADPYGDHQVGCGGNNDRIARHNAIRDVLFSTAQAAALAPTKEAPSLVPGSNSRPADILLPVWQQGRPAALDVSVISPLQQLTITEAATTPGHALTVGVRRKLASNLPACRAAGVDFFPVVVETLGGWCPDAIAIIRAVGIALEQRLTSTDSFNMTKHLFGRLAIALWRGNASLWSHRQPTIPSFIDGLV